MGNLRNLLRDLVGDFREAKASMLQDLEKGLPCEVESINGYLSAMARKAGVAVPVNDQVTRIIRDIQGGRRELGFSNLDLIDLPPVADYFQLAVCWLLWGAEAAKDRKPQTPRAARMQSQDKAALVFSDPELQFQLMRALGDTAYGQADIGECLSTAERITEGDVNSWYEEWYATAERVRGIAEESLTAGHAVSAREAYLRASTYYAMAEFYLHGDPTDPRIRESTTKSQGLFRPGGRALSRRAIEPVKHTLRGHHPPRILLHR